jgi:hypothetical protein
MGHEPAVDRDDQDREDRREHPEVLGGFAPQDGADGFAYWPHGEISAEHAEQQHETDDHDACFDTAHR